MDEITAVSALETITVLYNTDIDLFCKVPDKILNLLHEKAKDCKEKVILKSNTPLCEQPISDEAKSILSIIYKDYLAENEKKEEATQIYNEDYNEYQNYLKEKYNPFKDVNNSKKEEEKIHSNIKSEINSNEQVSLILPHKKWYEKIFQKIKSIFNK